MDQVAVDPSPTLVEEGGEDRPSRDPQTQGVLRQPSLDGLMMSDVHEREKRGGGKNKLQQEALKYKPKRRLGPRGPLYLDDLRILVFAANLLQTR